jgi:DNA replication protein DnaC
MRERIKPLLDSLRLKGMANCIEDVLNDAENQGKAITDVLLELLEAQHRDQQERSLANRIKLAKLPWSWAIDTFPFKQQPGIKKTQIMGLANLTFIQRNENIIFIGKPGTGKSGIAMGLLRLALLNGHRGRFYNAQDMLNELYSSLADRTTSKLFNNLCSYEILVIDELGYLTLTPEQINMFFKLIDMRYQRKSTIITTNLDFEDWYAVFKQKGLVDAMLDRFKHHCTIIHINGPSLRVPQSSIDIPKNKKTTAKLVINNLDDSSEEESA